MGKEKDLYTQSSPRESVGACNVSTLFWRSIRVIGKLQGGEGMKGPRVEGPISNATGTPDRRRALQRRG